MQYDVVIAGAGIVGLATALKIKEKKPHLKVAIIEKEKAIAQHQTGNNSGVIHAGIYYKPGSLKANNCLKGYGMLLDFCDKNNIKYNLCGKVIVATEDWERPILENIYQRGLANGLDKIQKISKESLKETEPHANGLEAIKVPYTGIIDYKDVSNKMAQLFQQNGGELFLGEKVIGLLVNNNLCNIQTDKRSFTTKLLINCAGLYCDKIAAMQDPQLDVRIIPFRGEYYEIKPERQHLVKTLIYPVPDPNFPFLGVHFTNMVHGGVEAGPNAVFAFGRESYKKTQIQVGETLESLAWPGFRKVASKYFSTGMGEYYRSFSKAAFTKALQKLVPELKEEDLIPGGAGIRAQACHRDGSLLDDFCIKEMPGTIHVLNAPSPAATSSLSIGDTISDMAISRL
jgi:(S)-2-hydroxyglutarate dehydrogenase